MGKLKFVHYINQFFANIGGEEKADYAPEVRDGVVGPGLAFNQRKLRLSQLLSAETLTSTRT